MQISVERSFEAWEEVQRHGHDLADRLAAGFTDIIQSHHISPPSFPWPNNTSHVYKSKSNKLFDLEFPSVDKSVLDIGNRIGQAGTDFGGFVNGVVQQFFRPLTVPFKHDHEELALRVDASNKDKLSVDLANVRVRKELLETWRDDQESSEVLLIDESAAGFSGRTQSVINITSTYESRTHEIGSSLAARGDLWRVEASNGGSTSANNGDSSSLFLVQLGPLIYVRDSTVLVPVHVSKQHLLWYGYNQKNGMHSLCPAVWSKHRRWLLMSMLCLNPVACSFVDLQFPNGQFTYTSGEGLNVSAFVPVCGGLLQAQGHYPGEMRFSFSRKNEWGTCFTPMIQWPDKSFSMGLTQALAWRRSGIMLKPTIQLGLCPTFGGNNPGVQAEVIHSVNDHVSLNCGCAFMTHPSAFASVSFNRPKCKGSLGSSGVVLRADTPLSNIGRPSFSVRLNSVIEF